MLDQMRRDLQQHKMLNCALVMRLYKLTRVASIKFLTELSKECISHVKDEDGNITSIYLDDNLRSEYPSPPKKVKRTHPFKDTDEEWDYVLALRSKQLTN